MIKVLHTIDTTGPGGAETVFVNLVKNLDRKRFESVAVIHGNGWVSEILRQHGVKPLFIKSSGGFNFKLLGNLVRIIRRKKIDVIQAHLFGSNLYCSMAGLICRVPVISTIHGFVDASTEDGLILLKRTLINIGSSKIVFVSDRLRNFYLSHFGFSTQKTTTIYNGVDTSNFLPKKDVSIRKRLGIETDHFVIGAVGNVRPAKGYDIFLKAAHLVIKNYPKCRFILAGQGSGRLFEGLLKLRKRLHMEKTFHFIGFQENAAKVLNNMDIFVLPSTSEGFSISTIEAMSCGIPVVVTRSGGPEEIVQNNITGIFAHPMDADDLANKLLFLIKDEKLRKDLAIRAQRMVAERFSSFELIKKYETLYEDQSNVKLST